MFVQMPETVKTAAFDELDAATLYDILRLRSDVFVVEQVSPFPELDGRDREPGTRHWWILDGEDVVSYLRTLAEPDGDTRISRVVTRPSHRRRGLSRLLVEQAIEAAGGPVVVDAQEYLAPWYASLGFEPTGTPFTFPEDELVHIPMRKAAG